MDIEKIFAEYPNISDSEKKQILEDLETYERLKKRSVNKTLQERGNQYGKFVNQASAAQAFKNQLRHQLRIRSKTLDPDMMESLEMIMHKIARIINGNEKHTDSWHDIAGYAKLVEDRLNGVER